MLPVALLALALLVTPGGPANAAVASEGAEQDAAVFAVDRLGEVVGQNTAAAQLCAGAPSAGDWLFRARFLDPADGHAMRPAEVPAARLVHLGETRAIAALYHDPSGGAERLLMFRLLLPGQAGAMTDAPRLLTVRDETAGWSLGRELATASATAGAGASPATGGLLHDIANMLGAVRLSADAGMLARDVEGTRKYFRAIAATCDRVAALAEARAAGHADAPEADPSAPDAADTAHTHVLDGGRLSGRHLLCVEDDPLLADILVDALRGLGARVTLAGGAAGALSQLTTDEPCDILLTDLRLGGGDSGIALAHAARAGRPDLPVILFSGFAAPPEFAALPHSLFLRKPTPASELATAIEKLLAPDEAMPF